MNDIFERIKANNPWWGLKETIKEDSMLLEFDRQKFRYFHPLIKDLPLDKDAVLTLRGPRRVGKSTLLRLLIRKLLLTEKVSKEAVFFFPCDRVRDYNELFEIIKEYLDFARSRTNSRLFIFLDEISFIIDWQKTIKEMVDSRVLKNTLVILSGSSILDLKFGSEFLAGRRGQISPADIFYYPLNFKDFVRLVAPQIETDANNLALSFKLPILNKLFNDYLLAGGFPLTINEYYSFGRIQNGTYETFLTWVENDLHKTRRSDQTAYDLLINIFRTLTTPVSFTSLARDSNMASHLAAQEYIDILEKMFILFPLNAFVIEQKRRDPKKNKKIYFTDPFIFNSLFLKSHQETEDFYASSLKMVNEKKPSLVENAVAFHIRRVIPASFWGKTAKSEVDFVGKRGKEYIFVEVKYQEKIDYSEIPSIGSMRVVSKKTLRQKPIFTIPLEIFLLKSPDRKHYQNTQIFT